MAGKVSSKQRGDHAENTALGFLLDRGCRILARNFRSRSGEIDLIVQEGDTLVFVEVRYRSRTDRGTGAETVTRRKQRRIIRTAEYYLLAHKQYENSACRFDVISMDEEINWIRGAFTLDG